MSLSRFSISCLLALLFSIFIGASNAQALVEPVATLIAKDLKCTVKGTCLELCLERVNIFANESRVSLVPEVPSGCKCETFKGANSESGISGTLENNTKWKGERSGEKLQFQLALRNGTTCSVLYEMRLPKGKTLATPTANNDTASPTINALDKRALPTGCGTGALDACGAGYTSSKKLPAKCCSCCNWWDTSFTCGTTKYVHECVYVGQGYYGNWERGSCYKDYADSDGWQTATKICISTVGQLDCPATSAAATSTWFSCSYARPTMTTSYSYITYTSTYITTKFVTSIPPTTTTTTVAPTPTVARTITSLSPTVSTSYKQKATVTVTFAATGYKSTDTATLWVFNPVQFTWKSLKTVTIASKSTTVVLDVALFPVGNNYYFSLDDTYGASKYSATFNILKF